MLAAPSPYATELATAVAAATDAGRVVRDLYDRAAAASFTKGDGSPVTEADLAADEIIRAAIGRAFPGDAILTEEAADDHARLDAPRCWIVDPIDGTQQFINRTGEFDILIALVAGQRPVVAATYQPTTGTLLTAVAGEGAWVERDGHRARVALDPAPRPPRLLTSTWLGAPESMPLLTRVAARVGTEPPDISRLGVYARTFLPPDRRYDALVGVSMTGRETMGSEWDVACADLFIHEAGGRMTDLAGHPLRYNKPNPRNQGGLLLAVDPATHALLLDAITAERAAG